MPTAMCNEPLEDLKSLIDGIEKCMDIIENDKKKPVLNLQQMDDLQEALILHGEKIELLLKETCPETICPECYLTCCLYETKVKLGLCELDKLISGMK
jgi:hypothetical protein